MADATIEDARAQISDADAQTRHADAHMEAARARMATAEAHMRDADARAARAAADQTAADELAHAASRDADEYQRALYHYQQLVRHRLANPLQIIKGMAYTLLHQKGLGAMRRREMLEMIEEQAVLMERLSLFDTAQQGDEERDLRGQAFTDDR